MPKIQSKIPKVETPENVQAPGKEFGAAGPHHDAGGRHGMEDQQGQLEAEDFYSENHFVDEPDERNLK